MGGAMSVTTVNISFQTDLLEKIDKAADEEARSRSELLREAARVYVERRNRWNKLFSYGEQSARASGITEPAVTEEIKAYRNGK
jgi:CopG family transcriptional regulator / antitoxin EndoAI